MKSYSSPEDVKRDEVLFNLKKLMFYNSISLDHFLSYTGGLFCNDKNVTYQYPEYEFQDIDSYLNHENLKDLNFFRINLWNTLKIIFI